MFIEYQSQNATFERSILYRCAKAWNQMTVEERKLQSYDKFKANRRHLMLNNVR